MTFKERATAVFPIFLATDQDALALRDRIAEAIRQAVQEERQACAKVAMDWEPWSRNWNEWLSGEVSADIAKQIRARNDP